MVQKLDRYYYPDLIVVGGEDNESEYYTRKPTLIIEILSSCTALTDRREKMFAYKEIESLREYVMIEQNRMYAEIYRRREDGGNLWDWIEFETGEEIEFASVDFKMPMTEIYAGVELPELKDWERENNQKMIKAILMDFNGVIVNDEPLHMKAYQEILAGEGIALSEDHYYSCMGMDDKNFLGAQYRRAEKDLTEEKAQEIFQAQSTKWRELIDKEIPLFEGVENFVRKMEKDFALGIVSMARREQIEYVLKTVDLYDCFSTIVSAEDVSKCKPDAECYQTGFSLIDRARTKRGSNPMVHGDCLVIEDAPQGIIAGKNAGLKTLGISNTVSADKLRQAGADAVSKSLTDWMPDSIRRVFV